MWGSAFVALATVALVLAVAYRPLGDYLAWVFTSERHWRVERWCYRLAGIRPERPHTWRGYLIAVLAFSAVGIVLLVAILMLQPWLPYSLGLPAMSADLAFNTAASFVGNTNWQSYSPEQTVGYTAQAVGLTVQNFVSAAVSMAVAVALVRGFAARRGTGGLGNFWVDLVRANVRVLLPLSLLAAVILRAGGVIQNLSGFTSVETVARGRAVAAGRSARLGGGDQDARHEQRWLLQRELGAPLREPDAVDQYAPGDPR